MTLLAWIVCLKIMHSRILNCIPEVMQHQADKITVATRGGKWEKHYRKWTLVNNLKRVLYLGQLYLKSFGGVIALWYRLCSLSLSECLQVLWIEFTNFLPDSFSKNKNKQTNKLMKDIKLTRTQKITHMLFQISKICFQWMHLI